MIESESQEAYYYALKNLKGRYYEGESIIAIDSYYSLIYAKNIIQGRFPLGEAAIALVACHSYHYARYITGEEFPLGEESMYNDRDSLSLGNISFWDSYCLFFNKNKFNKHKKDWKYGF